MKTSIGKNLRTWIEIDSRAAKKNYDVFRKLLQPIRQVQGKPIRPASLAKRGEQVQGKAAPRLWSVVKSNAYGHGLIIFSRLAQKLGIDGFCVDSLVEGLRLRKEGIKKPILVLGPTLPALFPEAAKQKITITISNFEALRNLVQLKTAPAFHIKVDTGMHRQGFYLGDLPRVINTIAKYQIPITGIYTHFSSAKDINYPTYTEKQFAEFQKAAKLFEQAGFNNLIKHCAATGATLIDPKYHLDAVRVGIGLYGLWPSKELEIQLGVKIHLQPVLRWRAVISEMKKLDKGDYVGYDLAERIPQTMRAAIMPVGYWHGLPRSLSHIGEVLIKGRRAKIIGKVSMDLSVVGPVLAAAAGDVATLIGREGKEEISAFEVAQRAGTIHYEFLTRLNPLIERILS